jgi:hypothetical protein
MALYPGASKREENHAKLEGTPAQRYMQKRARQIAAERAAKPQKRTQRNNRREV